MWRCPVNQAAAIASCVPSHLSPPACSTELMKAAVLSISTLAAYYANTQAIFRLYVIYLHVMACRLLVIIK